METVQFKLVPSKYVYFLKFSLPPFIFFLCLCQLFKSFFVDFIVWQLFNVQPFNKWLLFVYFPLSLLLFIYDVMSPELQWLLRVDIPYFLLTDLNLTILNSFYLSVGQAISYIVSLSIIRCLILLQYIGELSYFTVVCSTVIFSYSSKSVAQRGIKRDIPPWALLRKERQIVRKTKNCWIFLFLL